MVGSWISLMFKKEEKDILRLNLTYFLISKIELNIGDYNGFEKEWANRSGHTGVVIPSNRRKGT